MTDMIVAIALVINSATLLHDDIIDGGETRRGRPSAFRRYGLARLVTGDSSSVRRSSSAGDSKADRRMGSRRLREPHRG